jgi:hypothetical protein
MFFTISKIFEFIGSPSHLALALLALGVGLAYTRYFKLNFQPQNRLSR